MQELTIICRLLYEDEGRRTFEIDSPNEKVGQLLFDIANQLKRRGKLEIRSRMGCGKLSLDQSISSKRAGR